MGLLQFGPTEKFQDKDQVMSFILYDGGPDCQAQSSNSCPEAHCGALPLPTNVSLIGLRFPEEECGHC